MTERQRLVYDFIQAFMKIKGFAPSYAEIAQGLKMTSKSNIHRHVHTLKSYGLLKVQPYLVRSMKIIDKSINMVSKR
jgi:repressor LexA